MRVWAVADDGLRFPELTLRKETGRIVLSVDTARLPCGLVFYFELADSKNCRWSTIKCDIIQ